MSMNAPNTTVDELNKTAVCPTPKSLVALVATLYPGYSASAMFTRRDVLRGTYKKENPEERTIFDAH